MQNDGFDFDRDVIGDDLVVGGVVYDSGEWVADTEDGVRRRTDTTGIDLPTLAEHEADQAADFRRRAAAIGAEFAAADADLSTGPDVSGVLRRHAQLVADADAAGFDLGVLEACIDNAAAVAI